jgi:hypothetical protein
VIKVTQSPVIQVSNAPIVHVSKRVGIKTGSKIGVLKTTTTTTTSTSVGSAGGIYNIGATPISSGVVVGVTKPVLFKGIQY